MKEKRLSGFWPGGLLGGGIWLRLRRGSHLIPALPRRGGEGERGCAGGADFIACGRDGGRADVGIGPYGHVFCGICARLPLLFEEGVGGGV